MTTSLNQTRRRFLETVLLVVGSRALVPRVLAAGSATLPVSSRGSIAAAGYRCLGPDLAAFTETMVSALCPADRLTPDGATCGLAVAIDRALARGSSAGRDEFTFGADAVNQLSLTRAGQPFTRLSGKEAAALMQSIFSRPPTRQDAIACWAHEVVNPLLIQACFAGPVYDGYDNRVFWKLFGDAHPPTSV
jgi:gluconate 2-dehydrogenase gamma chain